MIQETITPSGNLGWVVAPRLSRSMLLRHGVTVGLLVLALLGYFWFGARAMASFVIEASLLVLIGVFVMLYLRNERLIADRSSITRVDWLGRSRTWQLGDIEKVDRYLIAGRSTRMPYMAFMGHDGRQLFSLAGTYWDFKQVEEICGLLGLQLAGDMNQKLSWWSVAQRTGRRGRMWFVVALVIGALAAVFMSTLITTGR